MTVKIKDLSPKMRISSMEEELYFPTSFQDQTAQLISGFSAGSSELTHGNIHIQGLAERILLGAAVEMDDGIGIFMGKFVNGDGDEVYGFRIGDPAGVFLSWDGETLSITGFLEEGSAANDVNTNVTTINGGMITANTITATQLITTQALITASAQISDAVITSAKIVSITASQISTQLLNAQIASIEFAKITNVSITNAMITSITADKVSSGTLDGIKMTVGSGDAVFKVTSSGIHLGDADYADAPFRVSMSGDVFAKSIVLWGTIATDSGAYLRSSSGNDRVEFNNTDLLSFYKGGTLRGTLRGASANRATGIVASCDLVLANSKSFMMASSGGGADEYAGLGLSTNDMWLTLGTANKLYVKNNAQSTNYFTISSSGTYIEKLSAGLDCNSYNLTNINELHGDDGFIDLNSGHSNTEVHHIDPTSEDDYNCGGSDRWWKYVNAGDFTTHSMGFYDDGLTLPGGKRVSDVEAIKALKPHPTLKTKQGVPMIDKRTIPLEVFVPAMDHDGVVWERNKDGVPLKVTVDKLGKKTKIERPDADGESVVQFVGLALGAIKELSNQIIALQEEVSNLKSSKK